MLENMRRLHSRGAASRGISVDVDGAMLGPHCALVRRLHGGGYRGLERDAASVLQKAVFNDNREPDWLFRQTNRIAHALDKGEIALAQIYGLYIPIGELDDRQLAKISAAAWLTKSGYNPDEPRVPRGNPHGGEWTTGGTSAAASNETGADDGLTGPFAIDAMTGGGSSDGEDNSGGDGSVGSGQTTPSDPAASNGVAGSSPTAPPIKWEMKPLPNPPPAPPPVQDNSDDQPPPHDGDASESPTTLGSDDVGLPVPVGSDPADESGPNGASGGVSDTSQNDAIYPDYTIENLLFLLATGGLGWTRGALLRALASLGIFRPSGFVTHHIVAKGALLATPARAILERFGVDIDDAINGVFLPKAQHYTLHSNTYYMSINNELAQAKTKAQAEEILRSIARKLEEGKFP